MVIWWASFPMMILGLWFSLRYRLKMIAPILIFTTLLSIAYSVFQGNVGTAYRHRPGVSRRPAAASRRTNCCAKPAPLPAAAKREPATAPKVAFPPRSQYHLRLDAR